MTEDKYKKAEEIKRNIGIIEEAYEKLQENLELASYNHLINSSFYIYIPADNVLMQRIKDVLLIRKSELQNEFNNL